MVHLPTLERMWNYYNIHKAEIHSEGGRFAVIDTTPSARNFDTREDVYEAYPQLNPDNPRTFGTLPILIDIGKETNSPEYRREIAEKRKERAQVELDEAQKDLDSL